jgi:hypothetical protein
MHASAILQKCFADVFRAMHAARVEVLGRAVQALISARRLVLMDLARAWPGAERVRAPLKRLDRLLSNPHLHRERLWLYRALAHRAIQTTSPLIVVDWSVLKPDESWHLLRAAIAVGGRTLTLYEEVHCGHTQQSPAVHRAFLGGLQRVLPAQCRPIIVTDAGFRCPWFREVEALGWHWVGRVRNRVYLKLPEAPHWQLSASLLHSRARYTAFHTIQLVRTQPLQCQLLRYRQAPQGRKHRTRRGQVSRHWESREAARSQREPWLIAYSNSLQQQPLRHIVNLYRARMQIEQSFRDLKCERYGCAFNHSLTRKRARLQILLLLHALASFVAWLQGLWITRQAHTAHCVVHPSSTRTHYSTVRLGWESLRRRSHPPPALCWLPGRVPRWLLSHLGITA